MTCPARPSPRLAPDLRLRLAFCADFNKNSRVNAKVRQSRAVKVGKFKNLVQVQIMKIESSTPSSATPAKPRSQAASATPPSSPAADDASVALHLQQAGGLGASSAPFDTQRIAEIRQAIAEGRFQVDAEKIADRLINDVRDQLAKNRPPA